MNYYTIASDRIDEIVCNIKMQTSERNEDFFNWYKENDRDDTYEKMFNKFGLRAQKIALIEECAELITALSKSLNNKESNVLEEMADVSIVIEQLTMGDKKAFQEKIKEKHLKMMKYIE